MAVAVKVKGKVKPQLGCRDAGGNPENWRVVGWHFFMKAKTVEPARLFLL